MDAIAVLFGGALRESAFEELESGKNAFGLTLECAAALDNVSKVVLLVNEDFDEGRIPGFIEHIELIKKPAWTTKSFFETLSAAAADFDFIYYAWADTPLLDGGLAAALVARMNRFAAEYAYADGWPDGLAPELLLPSTIAFLARLNGDAELPIERQTVFNVLQKDINSFDIETEIAPVDLRNHRLNLAADSKRNLLLIKRLRNAPWSDYRCAEKVLGEKPSLLRTLPAFFPVMVASRCPQRCSFCPYDGSTERPVEFMALKNFESVLDKIVGFAGDGVIDLSLWGEFALHPEKEQLIEAVLARRELSLIIETCGLGWDAPLLDRLASSASTAAARENGMAPLSWIVSLDAAAPSRYRTLHGEGFEEATALVTTLLRLFPGAVYVQAIRVRDAEDDIEQFYRFWTEAGAKVIIQKYDDFCGMCAQLRAGDISPIIRNPCWHLMRDMPILIDGTVAACRTASLGVMSSEKGMIQALGNIFTEEPGVIWERGTERYHEHCEGRWTTLCGQCDEYYTYNF
ncbi:MAG: spiro-SPASM protein [Spirochaetaceae bacterium]|jgi:spiro-SPASM protein|nr:spiro-SPASM protein [Spirochaetaceae bacterium]